MWKQLKTPNLDPYLYQAGKMLTNWLGWCLVYAQTAFGAPWAGSTAWDAWSRYVKYKHEDRNLPSGVYCLLWFEHWGTYGSPPTYGNWGHVVIYKDGRIWSAPLTAKATADEWRTIEDIEKNYRAKYVGWSEDIGGLRVIKQEGTMPITQQDAERLVGFMRTINSEAKGWNRHETHSGTFDEREIRYLMGLPGSLLDVVVRYAQQGWDEGDNYRKQKDLWKAAFDREPALKEERDQLKRELVRTQALNGDATKWETLRVLLREFLGIK